jgi:Protein of unknown function (DUF1585)/Protein of unknown function (DUF1588)
MRHSTRTIFVLATLAAAAAVSGCSSGGGGGSLSGSGGENDPNGGSTAAGGNGDTAGSGADPTSPGAGGTPSAGQAGADGGADSAADPNLTSRVVDYGEAFRTASLKLIGVLPTLAQINAITAAGSQAAQATLYASDIDALLADPRFVANQIVWWQNTLKTGNQVAPARGMPSLDTAATFAASVVAGDLPYTSIFTATTGTCPTYANGAFTPATCSGTEPTAGILTDPGLMSQYFSNMSFRRVRFVQETFVCQKFPAEYSPTPSPMGSSIYTSPWPFTSIAGGTTAKINFQDTSAVICANCHTTENHMAPLFGHFDASGVYNATAFEVQTPVTPPVTSVLTDWLPAGQSFAWRNGTPVTDLPSLGAAIAADPDVARCAVTRIWNWAFGRGDVVNDGATVPDSVTDSYLSDFTTNGMKVKALIREVFTSDDFVRF